MYKQDLNIDLHKIIGFNFWQIPSNKNRRLTFSLLLIFSKRNICYSNVDILNTCKHIYIFVFRLLLIY